MLIYGIYTDFFRPSSTAFAVRFARNSQLQISNFLQIIFPLIKIVVGIDKQLRQGGQIQRQFRQALQIRATARQDTKLNRNAVRSL